MRVLRIFFGFIIGLIVLGGLFGLIWREIVLYSAIEQVRSAVRELRVFQPGVEFSQTCLEYGGPPTTDQSLTKAQLRFISDRDFVLEVVCQTNEVLREVVREETLPALVTKGAGESGLISRRTGHGLTLSVLGRTGAVYEAEPLVKRSLSYQGEPELIFDQGPTTVCTGYGFSCCNESYQLGQNQQNTKAWDCPSSCYASCIDQPVVLSFYSVPGFSTEERIVGINSGEPITFLYIVNDIQADALARSLSDLDAWEEPSWQAKLVKLVDGLFNKKTPADTLAKIIINFGDSEAVELSDLQGGVSHTYTCDRQLCIFTATIQAVTGSGITSTLERQSRIQIEVQGQ